MTWALGLVLLFVLMMAPGRSRANPGSSVAARVAVQCQQDADGGIAPVIERLRVGRVAPGQPETRSVRQAANYATAVQGRGPGMRSLLLGDSLRVGNGADGRRGCTRCCC